MNPGVWVLVVPCVYRVCWRAVATEDHFELADVFCKVDPLGRRWVWSTA